MFQDFLPKLKGHLLPRLKAALELESTSADSWSDSLHGEASSSTGNANRLDWDSLYFKSDQIYLHKLARIQYTTYDVRREQDVINPTTPHRDIMLLATTPNNDVDHPFLYARVLGIYHANVVYTGDGVQSYQARRFEFLWVRWYQYQGQNVRWCDLKLDVLAFPPLSSEGAFGFVDPGNIIRACHVIPAFSNGKRYRGEVDLSRCANDSRDWSRYYVNRWVYISLNYSAIPLIFYNAVLLTET